MKKILIAIASLIISGCSDYDNVGEDYNMLMVCNDVRVTSHQITTDVEVITTLDYFDVKPIGYCDWVSCARDYSYVDVRVAENKSTEDRECFVEVYNDRYNLRDTFLVHQSGVFVPSNGGNGGGSGGGSGTNVTKRRCAARTKKGTRCKRTAAKGSIYCWQHKK